MQFNVLTTFHGVTGAGTGEHEGVASSGPMVAVPWNKPGAIAVFNTEKGRTFEADIPLLKGHIGAIQDMQWSHFESRLLATSADDGTVKFWVFDDEKGLTSGHREDADMEI